MGEALKRQPSTASIGAKHTSWGLFEPLHQLLRPIIDASKPLLNLRSLVALLLFLLVVSWFRNSRSLQSYSSSPYSVKGVDSAERAALWEDIWRSEEEALWAWLESRVGLQDGLTFPTVVGRGKVDRSMEAQQSRSKSQSSETKLMTDREAEWAIHVTEEKLKLLKHKIGGRSKDSSGVKSHPGAIDKDSNPDLTDEQVEELDRVMRQDLGL